MTGQDFINLIQENNLQAFEMVFDYEDFAPLQSDLHRNPRTFIDEEKIFTIPLMIKPQ